MPEEDNITCPVCQYENPKGAVRCGQCNVPLHADASTLQVPDSLSEMAAVTNEQMRAAQDQISANDVVFYIAGEIQPLIIQGSGEIVLGRSVGKQPDFLVDMTQFHGHLLGVSRNHAILTRMADGYVIEDLNSTNGTWLNELRLEPRKSYPIKSGDQLRIGQLVLFVYFAIPAM